MRMLFLACALTIAAPVATTAATSIVPEQTGTPVTLDMCKDSVTGNIRSCGYLLDPMTAMPFSPFQAGQNIGNTSFSITGTLPPFASPPTVNLGTPSADTIGSTVALGALNATATVATAGQQGVGMSLAAGTLIGTLTPQILDDAGNWVNSAFYNPATQTYAPTIVFSSANSVTTQSIYLAGGVSSARVIVSSYTSGTANATLRATAASTPQAPLIGGSVNALPPGGANNVMQGGLNASGNVANPLIDGTGSSGPFNVAPATNLTPTDCSGTLTTGGTAQAAFGSTTTKHGFDICNIDAVTNGGEPLWFSTTTTALAAAASSYPLTAPQSTAVTGMGCYRGVGINTALSVVAATTGHKFSCTWW